MALRLEMVEVGSRVSYEDMANPRREGRVSEIVDDGRSFVVVWDDEYRFDGVEGTESDLRQHGWFLLADLPGNPFDGAEIIATYTRLDAIRDGTVVPTADLVPDEPHFVREAGFAVPVDLTAAVAAIVRPTERERERGQDVKGRLWDLLMTARMRGARVDAQEWQFPCIFYLAGRPDVPRARSKTLAFNAKVGVEDGEAFLTIMLPGED